MPIASLPLPLLLEQLEQHVALRHHLDRRARGIDDEYAVQASGRHQVEACAERGRAVDGDLGTTRGRESRETDGKHEETGEKNKVSFQIKQTKHPIQQGLAEKERKIVYKKNTIEDDKLKQ